MKYKVAVNCPDDQQLINALIDAAAAAGAGVIGKYSRVAIILKGYETWKSEEGAHPYIGEVGKRSVEPSVRIEMQCPDEKLKEVDQALRKIHPYQEPVIEIIKLENIYRLLAALFSPKPTGLFRKPPR